MPKIAPEEWDFRSVEEAELMTALLYEYTRCSTSERGEIEGWQAKRVDLAYLRELNFQDEIDPILEEIGQIPKATNADAIKVAFGGEVNPGARSLFLTNLWLLCPRRLAPFLGESIALSFTDFSRPWPQLKREYDADDLAARLLRSPDHGAGVVEPQWSERHIDLLMSEVPTLDRRTFLIDWSFPTNELLQGFRNWIKNQRPDHPASRVIPGPKGMWERLKRLSAFRIHAAGYSFEGAKQLVHLHEKSTCCESQHDVLPRYDSKSAWSKAVGKCRAELEGNFTVSIMTGFGFGDPIGAAESDNDVRQLR